MKKPFEIDAAHNRVDTGYLGDVIVDDCIETIKGVIADPKFQTGMDAICDFSDATVVWGLPEMDRLRKFIQTVRPKIGHARWAVIFPKGKDRSTARIFVALHNAFDSHLKIKLFTSRYDANEWLNSPKLAEKT